MQQEDTERQRNIIRKTVENRQDTITDLSVELKGNAEYQALHELEHQAAELENLLLSDKKEMKRLHTAADQARKNAEELLKIRDVDVCIREYADLLVKLSQPEPRILMRQITVDSSQKTEGFSVAEINLCLEKVLNYKKSMYVKIQEKLAEKRVELRTKEEQMTELRAKISQLERKRLTYPPEVTALAQKIREQFRQMGRSGEVRVLCELLDITNPAWQNAVEGYLNNQRFYLLVEPEDFDLALSVYDRMRENKKAYGAGLINTGKLEKYEEAPEGSLAEVVTSKSMWARRYINMVLGKVQRCQRYQDLKKYPTAITRQCMRYQNHVVSAIRPEVYQTPYIGREAYLRQLEQCRVQEKALQETLINLGQRIETLESVRGPLDSEADVDVKYLLPALEEKREHEQQLAVCRENIKQLKKNSTLLKKQIHLEQLREEVKELQKEISALDIHMGRCQQEEQQWSERLTELNTGLSEQEGHLAELVKRLGAESSDCIREYEKQKTGRELWKFKENFERARKANWTLKEKAETEMIHLMRSYKTAHDFGAAESLEGYPEFVAEYDKLKNSQLLTYEEKVQKARQAAEEEFREQFLSKLQENIKQAQNEFKELNRSLREIHFSREQYEFLHEPGKKFKKYYQMIMDDFNVLQGESIFSGMFRENHREVIEELFEKLVLEDEGSTKTLEEFTDYRSYMDYDIKIQSEDGSYMLYSKVSQEKSGGETQTPFYITVAASFMQLYRNSIGSDAIGLVMLDEAFNNMDDERIAGVLEFMTHANLQVLIAAPPDKIQYIGPAVKKVLLVLQDDQVSYVEDFTRTG